MALIIGDNFGYQGKKHLDSRREFNSIEEMKNYPSTSLPSVFYAFVGTTEYKYNVNNEFDEFTGKWRIWEPDTTGGSKDEIEISETVPTDTDIKLWVKSNEYAEVEDLLADTIINEFTTVIQNMLSKIRNLEIKVAYLEKVIENGQVIKPEDKPNKPSNPNNPTTGGVKIKIEDNSILKLEDNSLLIFEKNI